MPQRKTATQIIAPKENCPSDNCPPLDCPEDTCPRTISPRIIAPEENYLSDDFDFCIRTNFINTVRLKLLRKEEQVKNKFSME